MYKGITPTFTLTLPNSVNLDNASNVYVSFAGRKGETLITKASEDLSIDQNVVSVYLTQEETLSFPTGPVNIQINWTYIEGNKTKRACSDIVTASFSKNLEQRVLT